jgi:hypothetical protein
MTTNKNIRAILDGDIPWDAPQWIVEFHDELNLPGLTPAQAFSIALLGIKQKPVAIVTHVRSGLMWDVRIVHGKTRVMEVSAA